MQQSTSLGKKDRFGRATTGSPAIVAGMPRWWRAGRSGLAFALFALGSLFIAGIGLPVLRLLPGDARRRELRGQRLVHLGFRMLLWLAQSLRVIRVVRLGTDRLRVPGPLLVIANHPTLIDVVLLVACMPQADCVVKHVHWRNPVMREIVKGAGYIPNRHGNSLVEACVDKLRQGRTLLLFPEGTRSPEGRLGAFRRGAAHIALRSGCNPIPVTIRCEPPAFMKGARWHDVPDRIIQLTVEVGEPFAVRERPTGSTDVAMAARRVTAALRTFYEDRLAGGRPEHA